MLKVQRNYQIGIQSEFVAGQAGPGTLIIAPPFTLEFDVLKNSYSSSSTAHFRIYNLSERNRNQIRFDQTNIGANRRITFLAGYGDQLSVAFDGNFTHAYSVREGTNWITHVEANDGGFAFVNGSTSMSFRAGTPVRDVVNTLVNSLSAFGIQPGVIGDYPGTLLRGNTYTGNTFDILNELTGGGFFISNGKAYCLNDVECVNGPIPLINSQSGLISTPVLENTFLHFDMLFEPRLLMKQEVELNSIFGNNSSLDQSILVEQAKFNGQYQVVSLHHHGMISESVCGEAVTTVGLAFGIGNQVVGP